MPTYADSNRVAVRYIKEATWGDTPAGPVLAALPITSESFQSDINTVTSDTIRSDRNVADITVVGGGASGDVGFEMRYGDWDAFIEGALQSTFATTQVTSATASAHVSAAVIKADTSALNNVVVGQFLRITDAPTSSNNGDYRVLAISSAGAGDIRLTVAVASTGASAAFSGELLTGSATIQGKMIRNGTTPTSFTIEKEFSDVSAFHVFRGMRVTTMSFNFEAQNILTGSFGFQGKSQIASTVTAASATTDTTSNPVMNASGHLKNIWEGAESVSSACFQAITVDLNNNPREQACIGNDQLSGIGTGRCEITGTLRAYFRNNTTLNKFTSGTATNFRFQVTDENGASYILTVPQVRLQEGTIVAGGPNEDVIQEFSWGAFIDDSSPYSIQIDVLDA